MVVATKSVGMRAGGLVTCTSFPRVSPLSLPDAPLVARLPRVSLLLWWFTLPRRPFGVPLPFSTSTILL